MAGSRGPLAVWAEVTRWRALLAIMGFSARGRLRRASVRFDPDGPILLLSPHADDAVLNCWSVLTRPDDVRVVNIFVGAPRPGFVSDVDRACGAVDSAAHVQVRLDEDAEVLASVGRRPLNLQFLDIQYGPRRLTLRSLDRAVAGAVPAASLAYAPAALGVAHADHLLVRAYARALARAGVPVRLYADLPYAAELGWPRWVSGAEGSGVDLVDRIWRPSLRAVPEIAEHEVVTLDAEAAAAKLAAMRAYRTQFEMLDVGGVLSGGEVPQHEVFWRIPARGERANERSERPYVAAATGLTKKT